MIFKRERRARFRNRTRVITIEWMLVIFLSLLMFHIFTRWLIPCDDDARNECLDGKNKRKDNPQRPKAGQATYLMRIRLALVNLPMSVPKKSKMRRATLGIVSRRMLCRKPERVVKKWSKCLPLDVLFCNTAGMNITPVEQDRVGCDVCDWIWRLVRCEKKNVLIWVFSISEEKKKNIYTLKQQVYSD